MKALAREFRIKHPAGTSVAVSLSLGLGALAVASVDHERVAASAITAPVATAAAVSSVVITPEATTSKAAASASHSQHAKAPAAPKRPAVAGPFASMQVHESSAGARVLSTPLTWRQDDVTHRYPSLALASLPADARPVEYRLPSAGIATGGSASADGDAFTRRFYVGGGIGASRLDPRSFSDALTVGEENDTGFNVFAGYDINRWLSAEIYFADLGTAGIDFLSSPVGEVDYQVFGLNAVGYLFNSRSGFSLTSQSKQGAWRREGLSLYLKAGIGGLSNSSGVPFDQDYSVNFNVGAGLEYGFDNGFAVRADISSYDYDAQYVSVSVLKRFGDVAESPSVRSPVPAVVPVAPAAVPQPEPQQPVEPELAVRNYFAFDKIELDADSRAKLDALVRQERGNDTILMINGHTDSVGTETYNQALSERRARAVRAYLVDAGIDPSRLRVRGFGELQPAEPNDTAAGRAENRRADVFRR